MELLARIPSGRAGRMWLRRRLDTAERGRDQLDRKLRILLPEREQRRIQAEQRRTDWLAACEDASTWMLRATLLGGEDAIRNATAPQPVDIEVMWTSAMGMDYPVDARLVGSQQEMSVISGNAAVAPATVAYGVALLAGARLAAADEAVRRVEAEIAVTRRRLRALESRWLPRLHEALAALEQSLEQAEREEGVRLRRAISSDSGGISGAGPCSLRSRPGRP